MGQQYPTVLQTRPVPPFEVDPNYFPQVNMPRDDDVEIIDLDDPRDNIKPTTWHS